MKLHTARLALGPLLALGISTLPALPLLAATEITGDIPVELAKTLLFPGPDQNLKLYSDLPDGFPLAVLPADMEVVVSIDQAYQQRVLLRPGAGVAAGNETLRTALIDAGWSQWQPPAPPMQAMMPQQNGFIAGPRLDAPQMFCKEGAGMLQLNAVRMGQDTLFQFSYNVLPPGAMSPCNQGPADAMVGRMNPMVLQQHMPRLELPPALTSDAIGMRPGGMMSSGSYFESSASVSTDLSLAELFRHFQQQVDAQGWQPDANVAGDSVASGFWRKQPEAELDLVGTLTVIRREEQQYELQFRVQRLGDADMIAAPAMGIRALRSFGP